MCEYLRMADITALQALPPEAWGHRLNRMRDLAGYTQTQAIERLSDFMEISDSTLSRLESRPAAPTDRRQRQKAWALAVSYGYDPVELDLGPADQPPLVVVNGMLEQGFSVSRCTQAWQPSLWADGPETGRAPLDLGVHDLAA